MFSFRRFVGSYGGYFACFFRCFGAEHGFQQQYHQRRIRAQPQAPAAAPNQQGPVTVQARIRARREARRAQAIHDTYAHLYEVFVGGGYQRFTPGPTLQRTTMYSWDVAVTRYWSEKLGLTFDGRGQLWDGICWVEFDVVDASGDQPLRRAGGADLPLQDAAEVFDRGKCEGRGGDEQLRRRHERIRNQSIGTVSGWNDLCAERQLNWRGECDAEFVAAAGA